MVMHHFAQTLDAKAESGFPPSNIRASMDSSQHYFGNARGFIPVTHDGVIDLDWLTAELADTRPGLVGVMAANNETGVIQPWREMMAICQQYEVPFFTDAVQWIGKMPAKGLGECDFVSGAAHKFGGPRGIGFLKVPHRSHVTPLLLGGKQEGGRRAGTENVPIIVAMLAALEMREKQIARNEHILRGVWRDNFERQLLHTVPGTTIVGANQPRLWNTVSALMPEGDRKLHWVVNWTRRVLPSPPARPARPARKSRRTCSPRWDFKAAQAVAPCVSAAAGKPPKRIGTRSPRPWPKSTPRCTTARRDQVASAR